MDGKLLLKVRQRKERMQRIKAFLVFPMAALHFAIMSGRARANELMLDSQVGSGFLKKGGDISITVGKTISKFKTVLFPVFSVEVVFMLCKSMIMQLGPAFYSAAVLNHSTSDARILSQNFGVIKIDHGNVRWRVVGQISPFAAYIYQFPFLFAPVFCQREQWLDNRLAHIPAFLIFLCHACIISTILFVGTALRLGLV